MACIIRITSLQLVHFIRKKIETGEWGVRCMISWLWLYHIMLHPLWFWAEFQGAAYSPGFIYPKQCKRFVNIFVPTCHNTLKCEDVINMAAGLLHTCYIPSNMIFQGFVLERWDFVHKIFDKMHDTFCLYTYLLKFNSFSWKFHSNIENLYSHLLNVKLNFDLVRKQNTYKKEMTTYK